jgi:prepilin-type N-terminal cleavage/methylation domain-containing protein
MIRPMLRAQAGYTMAELLVTAAVVAVVMSGLLSLLMSGQQTYLVGTNRAEAQQNSRLVINRMIQELRTAGYDPQNTGSFAAVTALASGTGFVLRNDWNASGAIETNMTVSGKGEQITYTLTGNTLTRQESNVDGSAVTMSTAVNAMTIQYLDADDAVVSTPSGANAANIRTVVIDVTTNPDTTVSGTAGQVAVSTMNRVRIRNR